MSGGSRRKRGKGLPWVWVGELLHSARKPDEEKKKRIQRRDDEPQVPGIVGRKVQTISMTKRKREDTFSRIHHNEYKEPMGDDPNQTSRERHVRL